jgi:ATP-dependent DNA helicase RecG
MTEATGEMARYAQMSEGQYFDRKSARIKPEDVVRHIIAFANASGGQLVIGIEDNGRITGFRRDNAKPVESFEQTPITLCKPTPKISARRIPCMNVNGEMDEILVLDVSPSSCHVVQKRNSGEVWLRENDNSVRLDYEQVRALEYDRGQLWFEDEECRRSSIEHIDHVMLDRYKRTIGASNLDDEQVLKARDFLAGGHLTNAGVLLFSQLPTRFLPSAHVRVLKVDGTELHTGTRLNIVKDTDFEGPLVTVTEQASQLISSLLREFQVLGQDGRFHTVPEYPFFAWFEGLVNAIVHRDYSIQGEYTRAMIFDDRMEITSPGSLPNTVTLENMRVTRFARNPKICHALTSFELVRELNEGVHRMYEEMSELGLPEPEYSEPSGFSVRLVLRNGIEQRIPYMNQTKTYDEPEWDVRMDLSDTEKTALSLIETEGRVTTSRLASAAGISSPTASRILKRLAEKKLIMWHGSSSRDPKQFYSKILQNTPKYSKPPR